MRKFLLLAAATAVLIAQSGSGVILADAAAAKWEHEANDPPGAESVTLRDDAKTGAFEMLVRYPAGHKFAPHWHSANERMLVLEGTMQVEVEGMQRTLGPGSYAYMPAKLVQKEQCISTTRCAFYVHWDGKLDFHR